MCVKYENLNKTENHRLVRTTIQFKTRDFGVEGIFRYQYYVTVMAVLCSKFGDLKIEVCTGIVQAEGMQHRMRHTRSKG